MAKAPPISVRVPPDVLERLDGEASQGLSRNAIIIQALRGRYRLYAPQKPAGTLTIPRPKYGALLDKKKGDRWRL